MLNPDYWYIPPNTTCYYSWNGEPYTEGGQVAEHAYTRQIEIDGRWQHVPVVEYLSPPAPYGTFGYLESDIRPATQDEIDAAFLARDIAMLEWDKKQHPENYQENES